MYLDKFSKQTSPKTLQIKFVRMTFYPYSMIQIQTNKKPQVTFHWKSTKAASTSFLDLKDTNPYLDGLLGLS